MPASYVHASDSTGSSQNIAATLELNSLTNATGGKIFVAPSVRLSALNGAAASITLTERHYTGTVLIRENPITFAKPQTTSTVAGLTLDAIDIDNNEKLTIAAKSSNASDTAAAYTISWLNAAAADLNFINGGTVSTVGTAGGVVFPPVLAGTGNIIAGTITTLTTYTGNTPQTGDSFARLGVAGAGLTALGDARIANLDAAVSSRMGTYTQPTGFLAASFPAIVAGTGNILAGTFTTLFTKTGFFLAGTQAFNNVGTWTGDWIGSHIGNTYGFMTGTTGDGTSSGGGTSAGITGTQSIQLTQMWTVLQSDSDT